MAEVAPEQPPEFYKQMSAYLLHLKEHITLTATIYTSHLDQLTPQDLDRIKIDEETLKTSVQYTRITELETYHTHLLKRIEAHNLQLVKCWGPEWEDKFRGLLPPKPSKGLLCRLVKFGTGARKYLRELELDKGFQEIIDLCKAGYKTSKLPDIQVIEITNFERKLLNAPSHLNPPPMAAKSSTLAENNQVDSQKADSDRDHTGMWFEVIILLLDYNF